MTLEQFFVRVASIDSHEEAAKTSERGQADGSVEKGDFECPPAERIFAEPETEAPKRIRLRQETQEGAHRSELQQWSH